MTEHVHDYGLRVVSELRGAYVEVACRCGEELTGAETRRRLNEYDKLKEVTLSIANISVFIDYLNMHYKNDPWLCSLSRALQAYADILESI